MSEPPSSLDVALRTYRAALLRRDEDAIRRLSASYRVTEQRSNTQITRLLTQIRKAGNTANVQWLREADRLIALRQQIIAEWSTVATAADRIISETQRATLMAACNEAAYLIRASAGLPSLDVVQFNPRAFESLVGTLSDGSPLRAMLDRLGDDLAQRVERALLYGVATGRNPNDTAKTIRAAMRIPLYRAARIARTEHLRAYREATQQTYRANASIVRGWQWRASPSRRTCPVCLAMDGSEHPLDEPFYSHVNCRCTTIPLIVNQPAPPHESGAAWFDRQPADAQRAMLGAGKYARYADGKLQLTDLVGTHDDRTWGASRYEIPLRDLDT